MIKMGFENYLCSASKEAKLAALGPFMNWGSGLPGIFGLEEVTTAGLGNPKGGIPAEAALTWAADKKAGCCKAINWAAMGFNPGGPPGGPNPLPNGFLSSRGSINKMILKNFICTFRQVSIGGSGGGTTLCKIQNWYSISSLFGAERVHNRQKFSIVHSRIYRTHCCIRFWIFPQLLLQLPWSLKANRKGFLSPHFWKLWRVVQLLYGQIFCKIWVVRARGKM